ncbi:uncharacterized protein I303_102344 [Kwoniella dejecticola CBS 10117]|uniref:Ricin B lectin domain-containing protein n=1 Tax=Kwoniella dejecticola CBS 10117 TaxID=1296121 RepID=A0A1A6AB89_9TREE|nr:uncharacterized protein I303_01515 [Kwoniella dejecticola CBS 10117]OBR87313.1 hypothetical protein I303_01515 [Kwoniella dejecticola CBS 10117]
MYATTLFVALISLLGISSAAPMEKRYSTVKIRAARDNKCLSPFGTRWTDDTQVTTVDCAGAARWDINPGSGSVILHGSTYALSAVTGNANNEIVQLKTSAPGTFAQTWYLTNDNRIAITNGVQCLDEGASGPQTYQCTTGNTNQVWIIDQ